MGKREGAFVEGQPKAVSCESHRVTVLKSLIGDANECIAFVNDISCLALLDTGSQVSSVSQSFYNRHLRDYHIHSVENLIKLVGAGGEQVPYIGYIEVQVSFPEEETGVNFRENYLVLVVPDNDYNKRVPVVIGTNIAKAFHVQCIGKYGSLINWYTLHRLGKGLTHHFKHVIVLAVGKKREKLKLSSLPVVILLLGLTSAP